MALLLATFLLHEYIFKLFFPRYRLKAEAIEAARHFVECYLHTMAQEQLNTNDMMSLNWDTAKDTIKCEISAFGIIKLERKNGEIFLNVQDGNTRIRIHKDSFRILCQYKESIEYLMSFLESNAFSIQHGQSLVQEKQQ